MADESGRRGRGRPPPGVFGVLGLVRKIDSGKLPVAGESPRLTDEVLDTDEEGALTGSPPPRE